MVFLFHCSSSLYSVVKAFSFEQNVTMSYNLIAYGALFKKKPSVEYSWLTIPFAKIAYLIACFAGMGNLIILP